jgi:sarcosine oxidase, subunit alpha
MSRSGPYRLTYGGQIDRTRRVNFRYDGKPLQGHPGDTVASALLANGVRIVGRSFKFHRPRGIFSCGIEEPCGLLAIGEAAQAVPSVRAPTIELTEGLVARPQAGWPSARFDLGRALDFAAPLWSAGFYNKTFIWPSWHRYEGLIRRMAGLGRAPTAPDPDRYEVQNLHCDVLIVGGGAAGLKAAGEAARTGARVILVEQDRVLGGHTAWDGSMIEERPASMWLKNAVIELWRLPNVRVMPRTTAVGYYDHDVVALLEVSAAPHPVRERLLIVRTKRVVLATGVVEQPLIFSNNDRPGVVLAAAAHQYLRRYGIAVGSRVLIATNNDSAYTLAVDLKQAGITVPAVLDTRTTRVIPPSLQGLMRQHSIDVLTRCIPVDTTGLGTLRRVTVARLSGEGASSLHTFKCDALAMSGGFAPALQLLAQAGGELQYDEASGVLQPTRRHPSISLVGAAAIPVPTGPRIAPLGDTHRQWVDLLHDVTVADLELALRENYTSIEHIKRYTTVGMAADQGKTTIAGTLEVVGRLRGVSPEALGHTTLRPPVTPVTLGAFAGREIGERFAPSRHLPLHAWHRDHGGLLQDSGAWQRPIAYLKHGETREGAVQREARAVRTQAGLFDGSSLGKIEIQGPDALEFLDRFYINNLTTLKPRRVRYGFMLRETGTLLDDGTVVGLSPDHYVITTTTGNADTIHQWLEEWHQCEWPHLRVAITPVTEQWATLSLAGPRAREILSQLDINIDLSREACPHLELRTGKVLGLPARVYRVSFTGELSYEINIPSESALEVWQALLDAGAEPFGLDALMLLRLEKGYLHLGTDTNNNSIPDDVGWGQVARNKTRDFIGRRSLLLPEHLRPDRLQLVGVKSSSPLIVGSHLRGNGSTNATDGWITSAGVSVLSQEPIGLCLLKGGREKIGTDIDVFDAGRKVARATVTQPLFHDPTGDRLHA